MLGIVGSSLSLLGLAGFGGFALLAPALPLLGLGDLSLVIFQRTTDTFVEVNPATWPRPSTAVCLAFSLQRLLLSRPTPPSGGRPDLTR